VLLAFTVGLPVAQARDGAVSPPTCISIINAAVNCPAREGQDALKRAEAQAAEAQKRLEAAEAAAGHPLQPGESQNGEPEFAAFWREEVQRLVMNKAYLQDLRSQLLGGGNILGSSNSAASRPARFISRLVVTAPDVAKEVDFWCEAIGMQRYGTLPGGAAVVAFGPPGVQSGDEGAFFAVEIRPLAATSSGAPKSGPRLSFVQIATPSLIRISKVMANGGELIDGYGYYGLRSPAGVDIRAYVEDRRDPVELVALAAEPGEGFAVASRSLEALGLQPKGPYALVSPEMQAYMPELPQGNVLYAGTVGPGDQQSVQVLLLPTVKEGPKSLLDLLPRGTSIVIDENEKYSLDLLEKQEKPETTFSQVQGTRLAVLAPAGDVKATTAPAQAGGGLAVALELQSVDAAG